MAGVSDTPECLLWEISGLELPYIHLGRSAVGRVTSDEAWAQRLGQQSLP